MTHHPYWLGRIAAEDWFQRGVGTRSATKASDELGLRGMDRKYFMDGFADVAHSHTVKKKASNENDH